MPPRQRQNDQTAQTADKLLSGAITPEALAAGYASGGAAGGGGDVEDIIAAALIDTIEELVPSSGFKYGKDALPHWFPKVLTDLVDEGRIELDDLQGTYDPYMGLSDSDADDRVYMGRTKRKVQDTGRENPNYVDPGRESKLYGTAYKDDPDSREKTTKKRGDRTITREQAINMPYEWDDAEILENMKRMREAGLNVTEFDELVSVWGSLVDRASRTYAQSKGKRKLSPWDVLELSKRERQAAGVFTDFESGSKTTTYSQVTEISEGAAFGALQTTLSNLLGRDPSDEEVRDFAYRMNSLAAQNPSITETIQRYQSGEIVNTDQHTTGGFDNADLAQEAYNQAKDDPEYAKVQAGTTYYNALMGALGSVGEVGPGA